MLVTFTRNEILQNKDFESITIMEEFLETNSICSRYIRTLARVKMEKRTVRQGFNQLSSSP